MTDPMEKQLDDLIAKGMAIMARYGVNDPYDVSLSPESFHALQKELRQLRPRRPKKSKYSFSDDFRILERLSGAEDEPGGAKREAAALFNEMKAEKHPVASPEALRQRYHYLKRKMLEAGEKCTREWSSYEL